METEAPAQVGCWVLKETASETAETWYLSGSKVVMEQKCCGAALSTIAGVLTKKVVYTVLL